MRTAGQQALVPHSRPWITDSDREAVKAALDSMMIAEADLTRRLETATAEFLGQAGGVATPDGTTAIYLALIALGVSHGDEVVIPAYVCEAVEQAVRWTGASPVLCDSGEDWCVNVQTVRAALSRRTRAIVVVHTFGIVAETEPIVELGVPVVEDLAQAFGASSPHGRAGSFGDLAITSFHATKCLTTGEGGMACARDGSLMERLRALKRTHHRLPLPNLGAALGLSQLARYDQFISKRRQIAERYRAAVAARFLPPASIFDRTMHFRFPLTVDGDVPELMAAFAERGVLAKRGVDSLLQGDPDRFPGARRAFEHTISLPIHPSMSAAEVDRVLAAAAEVLSS